MPGTHQTTRPSGAGWGGWTAFKSRLVPHLQGRGGVQLLQARRDFVRQLRGLRAGQFCRAVDLNDFGDGGWLAAHYRPEGGGFESEEDGNWGKGQPEEWQCLG